MKALREEDSVKLVALAKRIPYADLLQMDHAVPQQTLELIPMETARNYMAVPFGVNNGILNVAMLDPSNLQAIDFISRKTGYTINAYMSSQAGIDRVLGMYKERFSKEVSDVLKNIAVAEKEEVEAGTKVDVHDKCGVCRRGDPPALIYCASAKPALWPLSYCACSASAIWAICAPVSEASAPAGMRLMIADHVRGYLDRCDNLAARLSLMACIASLPENA
jgi:hypothetical protein